MTAGSSFPNIFGRLFGGKADKQASSDGNSDSGGDMASNDKASLRTQLGLQTDFRTVLVVGGGDGMGGIVETARQLGDKLGTESSRVNQAFQMVVVCGKNEQAQSTLSNIEWSGDVNVCVKGFVDNMDEWMRASDVIVTKAGPGTIAEASICGLPCMLSSYLPGQEEGNVPYVKDNGFGSYSGNPQVIAETVCSWLESDEMMESMRAAALEASRPSATLDIARDIANMLFESKRSV
uniref:Glycosyl transferase family 28 C-terminal domain-containing protein n=1 Tax=Leptocylindrus danicus TaxID=163516 RepID=A0A7S2LK66_9STRA